ncbi:hypothetical protein LUZ60_014866 [Juncus effusus]|nr:hypothetical protein LUZ60_014866 [Juncus effusus]
MGSEVGSNGFFDGIGYHDNKSSEIESIATIPTSSSSPARCFVSHPSSPSSPSFANVSYVDHRVSKMDTLAGVAIKYGVEVADIRRLNGLSTDLQMYAHKTLRIPNPARLPPSYFQSNGSDHTRETTPPRRPHEDLLESLQSLKLKPPRQQRVSQAMSLLQGYYNLSPPPPKNRDSNSQLSPSSHKPTKSFPLDQDPFFLDGISKSEPPPNRHRKTRSLINGDIEESVRRRQKADVSPEKPSGKPKGLPLRPKQNNRVDLNNKSQQNLISFGDSLISDGLLAVRKSSSTSDLVDSEPGSSSSVSASSIWAGASKWTLKPDSFAFPIFDGIPNPISSWRNKAAKD